MDIDHIFTSAQRRKDFYTGEPGEIIFADRLITLGIAQTYQELMRDAPVEVRIFRERKAAQPGSKCRCRLSSGLISISPHDQETVYQSTLHPLMRSTGSGF